jgi:glycosyltransferase involved in cell wall biosynthesis
MKLSIITINFNDAIGLKKTIKSVNEQTFTDFEYIIIDGGSTDESVEIIKESSRVNYWISEPDSGIYNAMNKGILVAKGDYLLMLNSGDWFCDKESLGLLANKTGDFDIIFGDTYFVLPDNKIEENKLPQLITFNYLAYYNAIPHQATLVKKEFIIKNGLYDENLKIASDWKFFLLSFFKWNASYVHKPHFICYYDFGGISSTNRALAEAEEKKVLEEEFSNFNYLKEQMILVDKILFSYKYSRVIRILKALRLIKKIDYPKSIGF